MSEIRTLKIQKVPKYGQKAVQISHSFDHPKSRQKVSEIRTSKLDHSQYEPSFTLNG